jgi:hypothetical protein
VVDTVSRTIVGSKGLFSTPQLMVSPLLARGLCRGFGLRFEWNFLRRQFFRHRYLDDTVLEAGLGPSGIGLFRQGEAAFKGAVRSLSPREMDESRFRTATARLQEAHQLRSEESDVVRDFIETRGRAATALISDLEVIPLADFYIEVVLTEMDLTEEPWFCRTSQLFGGRRCARERRGQQGGTSPASGRNALA